MDNPFLKRATEFFREEEAFLAVLSPEPIQFFLAREGRPSVLYDKLVLIRGTPGSGKTTLARVFEYPTLAALLRNSSTLSYQALYDTVTQCGALKDERALVVGCRLALETDYRDFWEFPYPENVKLALTIALIQARTVLTWMRHLQAAGVALENVEIRPRADAEAATEAIGGTSAVSLVDKARAIERSLYKIVGALVAPDLAELDTTATEAYRPFDVIDRLVIRDELNGPHELRPLVILDDAHVLAPAQIRGVQRHLARRELRVARWILMRLDVLHAHEAFEALTEERPAEAALPGITVSRDYVSILLQSGPEDRRKQRVAFRRMARDMASRYLSQMPLFVTRNLKDLDGLLSTQVPQISKRKLDDLTEAVQSAQQKLHVSQDRRESLTAAINGYAGAADGVGPDLRLAMLSVLLHRLAKRGQTNLFERDADVAKDPKVDSAVLDAARIHLLHRHERPYYVGFDDLCDASSENAEQFLRLAAQLVEASATNLLRGKGPSLDAATQNHLLRAKANEVVETWDFPQVKVVRKITDTIAERCLQRSLEPNASLGAGANAYGILQEEFDAIPERNADLARALQAAIANNALTVVPRYNCKNKEWCLLELGGMVLLRHGLTLKRGGFLEGSAQELAGIVREAE
jgi:hypothetical protein